MLLRTATALIATLIPDFAEFLADERHFRMFRKSSWED